jgi:hypothetical protein
MYLFTLVDEIRPLIEELRHERGDYKLVMLYNQTLDTETGWNLIVSSDWTDTLGIGDATRFLAEKLFEYLSPDERAGISRITVLRTTDPFVKDMTRLYQVNGTGVPLQQVTAGGVTEGAGFVFYSQPEVPV